MALSLGETVADYTGNNVVDSGYLDCANSAELSIRMHLDAIDGIANDVVEGVKSLPKRGAEIGGLLLGDVVTDESRFVRIERYERLNCEHRFGPQFALDAVELESLETAASSLSSTQELSVVGLYRSNTRADFQLEQSDFEILDRYFPDPGDLALLIQPVSLRKIDAQFFTRAISNEWASVGDRFQFRGRVVGVHEPEPEPEIAVAERPRRLVPDFLPAGESARVAAPVVEPPAPPLMAAPERVDADAPGLLKRWWPLACALLLVGCALFFLFQSQSGGAAPKESAPVAAQPVAAAAVRPLGLSVDPSGDTWRISWNPSASALQGARNVALFAREGEDQNRIDLAERDLQSGTYQYQPRPESGVTRDVTFRIEVTDATGNLSAESFRLMRTIAPQPTAVAAAHPPVARAAAGPGPSASSHPRPLKKVAPVVPASIRPRIHGSIPVDVRVAIDAHGRVTSAAPVAKPRNGLNSFLAGRAVAAARQWKFEAASGTEVIHFVFQP